MAPIPAVVFAAAVYLALAVMIAVFGYEVYALLVERDEGSLEGAV